MTHSKVDGVILALLAFALTRWSIYSRFTAACRPKRTVVIQAHETSLLFPYGTSEVANSMQSIEISWCGAPFALRTGTVAWSSSAVYIRSDPGQYELPFTDSGLQAWESILHREGKTVIANLWHFCRCIGVPRNHENQWNKR